MPDPNDLKAALHRVIAGTASEADCKAVQAAEKAGVLATGHSAVALGGDASDVIITTGDQNTLFTFKGIDAAAVKTALSSVTPQRLHQVPPPPADFTGREKEQQDMLAAIEHAGVNISGLRGLGGIGKTALALKLAEQLKPRYPDAHLYLDLKGASAQPLTSIEALTHVIRAYHPAAKLPESETELRGLYLSVLDGQRALILMDNAANADQVEPLIPPSSCVLLVTSRRHFTLPGLVAKNLDALSPEDGRALLLAIAPRIGAWANEIGALCGHLPLALRLAASAIANYVNLKPGDYVRRLEDTQQQLQLIEASLSLSYELLSEELKKRWRRLGIFPESFAGEAAAAVWEDELDHAQHMLGEFIAASMVEWNETASRYRLHDLARVFADAKLSKEERTVGSMCFATHYGDLLADAGVLYKEGGESLTRSLVMFDLEWGNIQAGFTWIAKQDTDSDRDLAFISMAYPIRGADLLLLRRPPREQIRWLEVSLNAAQQLGDRAYEGYALGNLGLAYAAVGETKRAIQIHEQRLAIARELGDRMVEGRGLNNLGNAYIDLGEFQTAIEYYEQRLSIARDLGDRRGEGSALGNLGRAYRNLGEFERAMQFHEQFLIISRELGDRRGEGNALCNMGVAYFSKADTKRACQLYEEALLIFREIGDSTGEAHALWNLSLVMERLDKRGDAIQNAEESLEIYQRVENPLSKKVLAKLMQWREGSGQD